MPRRWLILGLAGTALTLTACGDSIPTSVVLRIEAAPTLQAPQELRLTIIEEHGVVVRDRRLPKSGTPALPDSVVLYPTQQSGTLRLLVRAQQYGAASGEGTTAVQLRPGAQASARVVIEAGRLRDGDADGVPDVIDNCPALPNPDQEPCPANDAAAEGPLDARPDIHDVGPALDGLRDLAADHADGPTPKPDALKPDAPKPDAPKPDAPKPDTLKPDTLKPDAPMPDAPKPTDTRPPDTSPPVDLPPPAQITVLAPGAGATWAAGSTYSIVWTTSGSVPTVTIELWRGGARLTTLASAIANSGSRSWAISAAQAAANDYVVRVVSTAAPAIFGQSAAFAISNWRWAAPVTVDATAVTVDSSNYQVLVTLTATTFDYAQARADGSDLRFSTGSTRGSAFDLPHYRETWQTGSQQTSTFWVRLPQISAGSSSTIYLFYGNPQATSTSNLAAVFPTRTISTGNLTLGGTQAYEWFELAAGHTLTVQAGAPLLITARKIVIAGTIVGTGAGYAGGAISYGIGQGPGGGQSRNIEASGGGGHGGAGGEGGHDAASAAAGGPANGSATDETNELGSGGGATEALGGAGGGALTLTATDLSLSGTCQLGGADGVMSTPGRGTGGGAGGGLVLRGDVVTVTGSVSLIGGNGGTAPSVSYDGGGGGGGGRYKAFYQSSYSAGAATIDLAGGVGGCPTGQSGLDGAAGSMHTQQQSVGIPFTTVAPGVAF